MLGPGEEEEEETVAMDDADTIVLAATEEFIIVPVLVLPVIGAVELETVICTDEGA